MTRREFITLLGGAAVAAHGARSRAGGCVSCAVARTME
jgi:hypothetical protein